MRSLYLSVAHSESTRGVTVLFTLGDRSRWAGCGEDRRVQQGPAAERAMTGATGVMLVSR